MFGFFSTRRGIRYSCDPGGCRARDPETGIRVHFATAEGGRKAMVRWIDERAGGVGLAGLGAEDSRRLWFLNVWDAAIDNSRAGIWFTGTAAEARAKAVLEADDWAVNGDGTIGSIRVLAYDHDRINRRGPLEEENDAPDFSVHSSKLRIAAADRAWKIAKAQRVGDWDTVYRLEKRRRR